MQDKLTAGEQEILLRWFEYHMPMDMRHKLMAELPVYYDKLTGRGSVTITRLEATP